MNWGKGEYWWAEWMVSVSEMVSIDEFEEWWVLRNWKNGKCWLKEWCIVMNWERWVGMN